MFLVHPTDEKWNFVKYGILIRQNAEKIDNFESKWAGGQNEKNDRDTAWSDMSVVANTTVFRDF